MDSLAVVVNILVEPRVRGIPLGLLPVGNHSFGDAPLVDPCRHLALLAQPEPVVTSAMRMLVSVVEIQLPAPLFPGASDTYSPLISATLNLYKQLV